MKKKMKKIMINHVYANAVSIYFAVAVVIQNQKEKVFIKKD
jgi:hypothetical protein